MVDSVYMDDEVDRVKWKIGTTGNFKVEDLYLQLRAEGSFPQKFLWMIRIPMKVRIFPLLMLKNSVTTKDNLLKRARLEMSIFHLCSQKENIEHFSFGCGVAKLVWKIVLCAFHLVRPSESVDDLVGGWINSFSKNQRKFPLWGDSSVLDAL
jgi:hypothetical protein